MYTKIVPTNKKGDDEDLRQIYGHFEATIQCTQIHFYISGSVGGPELYTDMIQRINCASSNDIIYIHLNTDGGRLDTGIQLINAIRTTEAHVVTILDSKAFSLGTLIFLAGHEYRVHDNCLMMFHNFSSGTVGKGNEQAAELEATIKWFNKIMKNMASPFLTDMEIKQIVEGRDLWMDSDEIRKRLKKIFKETQQEIARRTEQKPTKKEKTEDEASTGDGPGGSEEQPIAKTKRTSQKTKSQ